jgi:hypothetical protein
MGKTITFFQKKVNVLRQYKKFDNNKNARKAKDRGRER